MKQVKRRALLVLLPVAALILGISIFGAQYISDGGKWAAFSANDHVYQDGRLAAGQILDRNGTVLYDAESGSYAEDWITRISTLHAVGDPYNNISTSAKSAMSDHLVGFDPVLGTTGGGNKLYLTLDADLNEFAYGLLAGRKGAISVYNYRTGEVLCMVSAPAFDPANLPRITDGDSQYEGVYLNRVLSSSFTPGSVFKVVTTAAALETMDGIMERTFTCTGSYEIGDGLITCPNAHGEMDLYGAFAHSCNCAYAQLSMELGGEVLEEYAEKAGLLDSFQVSGITTAAGSFDIGESYDLGWSGVGQYNDLVNPCGMMTLMGAIARGGTPVLPRLVEKERSAIGLPVLTAPRKTGSVTFDRKTCRTLQDMMANNVAVTYGQSSFGELKVCAKSGTAEVGSGAPHSWFVGFVDDASCPLAFAVLVENGGSGATVAGSFAAQILQRAVENSRE